jgi:hypothetical protein
MEWQQDIWQGERINIGDFVMVPSMQCTIYKVTEINEFDNDRRLIVKTPMKVTEHTKIKHVGFCFNDFKESEVIKIENW